MKPPQVPESFEAHTHANIDMQREAAERAHNLLNDPVEPDVEAEKQSIAGKILKTTAIVTVSAAGLTGLGFAAEGALNAQADHVYDVGHKAEQLAQQSHEQQAFQQGLENGQVTIPTPAPTDGPLANTGDGTEVISPKQITPSTDAPLPSPDTH